MKKRVLVLVLFLVLALALFACDDKSASTECEHVWGKWIGTNEGHYHVCGKCGDQSKVFNHNCDDADDIVNGDYVADCKVCNFKVHTPIYPAIDVIDEAQNATYLAEINQALNALDKMGESCDISASMTMYLNKNSLSSLNFSCKNSDDLYFVLKGNSTVIYHEEDGKIFSYVKGVGYDYEREYVCSVDDFLIPSEAFGSVDVENSIELDTSKCNITKDGNTYTVEAYATDMMGEEIASELVEVYNQLGLDSSILSKITAKATFEFAQVSYQMTVELNMVMAVEGQIVEMPFEVKTSIDYSEIEKIDFLNGGYKISPPSCIQEVTIISDASDTFKAGQYYAVQLQKGQYYALCGNESGSNKYTYIGGNHPIHVYDENGVELKSFDGDSDEFYNYNFVIPKDGLYYFTLDYSSYYVVTLIKCDYETIYDLDDPKTFELNTSGVIEGLYDLNNYTFTSEDDECLIIKNTSDIAIYVIVNGQMCFIKSGEDGLAIVNKGENQIIVTAKNITEKTNYSIECTELCNTKGMDMNNPEALSEDWSGDYLLANNFGKRYAKIHVEERGYYSIDVTATTIYGGIELSYTYIAKGFYDGEYYDRRSGDILEKGDYIVWIELNWNYDDIVLNVNLKYTFNSLEDKDVDVELPVCKDQETSKYIAIDSQKYDYEQTVKYRFTLDESAIIKYYSGSWGNEVAIYDENDNKLTLTRADYNTYRYIKLPAGNYYCTSDARNQNDETVLIFIVTDYTGVCFDHENMPNLIEDTSYKVDFEQGQEYYFKMKIEKDGTYRFPIWFADNNEATNDYQTRIYLYDADMNRVSRRDIAMHMFDLEAGDYYVAVRYLYSDEKERGYIFTLEDVTA